MDFSSNGVLFWIQLLFCTLKSLCVSVEVRSCWENSKRRGKEKGQAFWEEGREHQHEDKNMDANQQRGISGEEAGGSSAPGLRSAIPSFIMIWGQFTYSYEIEHKKV